MSKPVFKDIFRFSGRRNRKSYIYFFIALFLVQFAYIFSIVAAGQGPNGALGNWNIGYIGYSIFILTFIAGLAVAGQRCRDFGWTGWVALLWVLPLLWAVFPMAIGGRPDPMIGWIFAILIAFVPGSEGENRYGPDPLPKKLGTKYRDDNREDQIGIGARIKIYKGRQILRAESGVSVDGEQFSNVIEAEKWINLGYPGLRSK